MKSTLRFLNSKERKELLKRIKVNWDAALEDDYIFLMNNQSKLFIVARDIEKLDLSQIRLNNIGLYFGEITPRDELRLSIEGSSIIGKLARQNILELSIDQAKAWFAGQDITLEDNRSGFMIVKHKNDFLGCGKLSGSTLHNFVPKARRIEAMI